MPTARVVTAVVSQPVDLSPMGNTVSMLCGAEMPFASGRRIVISTQESGGVSQAPSYMRSRGGMFDGLGAELTRSRTMTLQQAFDITGGDQTGVDPDVLAEANAIANGDKLGSDEPEPKSAPAAETTTAPATSSWDWSKIGQTTTSLATTGADIYNKTKKQDAPSISIPTAFRPTTVSPKSNMTMYLVIGGVAAVGLLALIMLRKRGASAPATNPRRRR
jgi:hypothetical protein